MWCQFYFVCGYDMRRPDGRGRVVVFIVHTYTSKYMIFEIRDVPERILLPLNLSHSPNVSRLRPFIAV